MRRLVALLPLLAGACDHKIAGGRADGKAVFSEACARCHGDEGRPPPELSHTIAPRDLTAPDFKARATRALIEAQVRAGSKNGVMPAFVDVLTDAQIEAVAGYVLSL